MKSISIIIPVYNEADHIKTFVKGFVESAGSITEKILEIILIENGSTDESYVRCKELAKEMGGLVVAMQIPHPSYGEALKNGILASRGEYIVIYECDVMDAGFLKKSADLLEKNKCDFVVASKRHPESNDQRPFKRRMLTLAFNLYLKIFLAFPGTDTHGLKAIKSEVARKLVEKSITTDEVFQTEIVLLAHKMNFRVFEIPLQLEEKRGTRVTVLRRVPKVMNIIRELKRSLSRF